MDFTEELQRIIGGKDYETLVSCESKLYWGCTRIIKTSDGTLYRIEEGQPDRGAPFMNHKEVKEKHWKLFEKPSVENLEKLFSVNFLDASLFRHFIQQIKSFKKANEKFTKEMKDFLTQTPRPKIKDWSVQEWYKKGRQEVLDEELFPKKPKLIGSYTLPDVPDACQFQSDSILHVDVLHDDPNESTLMCQRCTLDIESGKITKGEIIDRGNGFPFFRFGHEFPIKPVTFGIDDEYTAEVTGQDKAGGMQRVIIKKGSKKLYEYKYPRSSNLGSFWVFDHPDTQGEYKNTLLFMYSMRDDVLDESYYVIQFKADGDTVTPEKRIVIDADSTVSFSPNGRMVYEVRDKEKSHRSPIINIVQF